ncbi:PepSY-associated TM helix domain-containing protein [Flavobacteriaceae bacterium S356]|uniref:PepSY-associated TM helix domain-containing protein n=1 Tax=Asprobacillus argus TaxID=3076534 RepID=A0ABU3LDN5_9FLAO|nr:PepSY-associated TM helix domain-containing protein [Flavobacteriaceae bacterium S356]
MKVTNRSLHRDIAYFYVGLLIAFSFSGIILNHRQDWYPMNYTYDSKEVSLTLPATEVEITKEYLVDATKDFEATYDGHRIRNGSLRVYFKGNGILDMKLDEDKGILEFKRKVPFIGQTMYLHKTTNNFWIWYSDIFGAAMIVIAVTGMLIPAGKKGFKKRGWKLALLGLLFPLLFLILFP